jgi:hypothetical protein
MDGVGFNQYASTFSVGENPFSDYLQGKGVGFDAIRRKDIA